MQTQTLALNFITSSALLVVVLLLLLLLVVVLLLLLTSTPRLMAVVLLLQRVSLQPRTPIKARMLLMSFPTALLEPEVLLMLAEVSQRQRLGREEGHQLATRPRG
jgi:hypothetical protein